MHKAGTGLQICQRRVLVRVLLLSQLLALLLALAPGGLVQDFWLRWLLISFCLVWISLVSLLLLCVSAQLLGIKRSLVVLCLGVCLLLVVTALFSFYSYPVLHSWGAVAVQSRGLFVLYSLALAGVIALLGVLYLSMYLDGIDRIQAQASAELLALHAQIRPHFLFNCLNTVAELIHHAPVDAERATLNLSALFRAALRADDSNTLAEELALARQYAELEQWRLGGRLQIDWVLPETLPELLMPVLTLQPLLENAIRHGVEPRPQGGSVRVELIQGRHWLTLLISNPVAEHAVVDGAGVALKNIERRLKLWFSEQAQLSIGQHQGTYRVKLTLPLEAV